MNWQALLDPDIQKFILEHQNADVAELALKKPPHPDWPYTLILDQIKSRQKSAKKFPEFLSHAGTILPHPDVIEQASSRACALYKASLCGGQSFTDLTAGSGADTFAMAENHKGASFAVERDAHSAAILEHNLKIFGHDHVKVIHTSAENFVLNMPEVDTVIIDPQRREGQKRGIFSLSECSPDIGDLLEPLRAKAKRIILKTSPVLDISKTLEQFPNIAAVHIVQYQKDCKELVFIFDLHQTYNALNVPIRAVHINDNGQIDGRFDYTIQDEGQSISEFSAPLHYLYEPWPAYQKAGAFKLMGNRFDLKKLHPNTHLYTGAEYMKDFPGRIFIVKSQCAINKKALKEILPTMRANLSVRNFPLQPDILRKKLGLQDGGEFTLFACEIIPHDKNLILCIKNENY